MRRFTVAVVLSVALGAVPSFALAQATPQTTPPAQAAQKPAAPAAAPAQTPPAPRPFPEGAKFAYMNIPAIAAGSAEGKASSAKVNALREKKVAELTALNKQLETAQQKVSQGGLLTEDARAAAQKDVERLQVEIQRKQQDAEAELGDLQRQLQGEFERKLTPVIQAIAQEKALHFLFSQVDSGLVWAEPALDLTAEIIRRFDAAVAAAGKTPQK